MDCEKIKVDTNAAVLISRNVNKRVTTDKKYSPDEIKSLLGKFLGIFSNRFIFLENKTKFIPTQRVCFYLGNFKLIFVISLLCNFYSVIRYIYSKLKCNKTSEICLTILFDYSNLMMFIFSSIFSS